MPSWLPSISYPPPDQPGYWQPVTSTLQWCEEDYYATYYAAEIVNTLTNSLFFYLAYCGLRSCYRNSHDLVFKVGYVGYFLTALGSFMFHASLKYPWQLVDELNMIYTTALMLFASHAHLQTVAYQWALAVFGLAFCAGVTAYYHYVQDPLFHQNLYGLMTLYLVGRSVWKMEMALRPRWRRRRDVDRLAKTKKGERTAVDKEQNRQNVRDLKLLRTLWILVAYGVTMFLSAFAVWNIDNIYCDTLRKWRRTIGLPWGIVLEGHGLWHLGTSIGAYNYLVWAIIIRIVIEGRQDEYTLVWPHLWSLPEVVRNDRFEPMGQNGHIANGHAKKSK